MKKCPACAEEVLDDAKKCKYCGEWLAKQPIGHKNPGIAVLLSILFPGAGHFYIEDVYTGLQFLVSLILLILPPLYIVALIAAAISAYKRCLYVNATGALPARPKNPLERWKEK